MILNSDRNATNQQLHSPSVCVPYGKATGVACQHKQRVFSGGQFMKPSKILLILASTYFLGCHGASVTTFNEKRYSPTNEVKIYTDITTLTEQYEEIGYVEAKGGMTVSKQSLLDDMVQQAKVYGANALIKVEFYDRPRYDKYIGGYDKPAAKAVMVRYLSQTSGNPETKIISGNPETKITTEDTIRIVALGFSVNNNGIIEDVDEKSPADSGGIKKGDRIMTVDKQPIPTGSTSMLLELLKGYPNTIVAFEIVRDRQLMNIDVRRR